MAAQAARVATLDGVVGAEGLTLLPLGEARLLVLPGEGAPSVWDLADAAAPRRLSPQAAAGLHGGGSRFVFDAAVPAEGGWALLLRRDGRWERVTRDGERLDGGALELGGAPLPVNLGQLRVSSDGLLLGYDPDGARVLAWRVPSGRALDWSAHRLRGAGGHAAGLALLDGGRALVCGSERDTAVRVYAVEGDKLRADEPAAHGLALERSLADRPRPCVGLAAGGGAYAALMECNTEWLLSDGRRSAFVPLEPQPPQQAVRGLVWLAATAAGGGLAAAVVGDAVYLAEPARLRQAADAVRVPDVCGAAAVARDDASATLAVRRLHGQPVEVWRVPLRSLQ